MAVDLAIDARGIATVTLNRPERLNALDSDHYEQLSRAFEQVRDNDDIRCAIVTGAGEKAFCAGADLKSFIGREQPLSEMWLTQQTQLLNRGLEVWKPVIAAVNGLCIGGGMTLLFATDIRIAASHAAFALPEGRRGIIAGNGGTQRIMRQMPYAVAMKMLLTGERMDAAEATRWGLINEVVEPGDLMTTARDYAECIAASAPLSIQATKELAVRSHDLSLAEGLRLEQFTQRLLMTSEDAVEGRRAFVERREPEFGGH